MISENIKKIRWFLNYLMKAAAACAGQNVQCLSDSVFAVFTNRTSSFTLLKEVKKHLSLVRRPGMNLNVPPML